MLKFLIEKIVSQANFIKSEPDIKNEKIEKVHYLKYEDLYLVVKGNKKRNK
jgi:hypothetical protein